MISFILCLALLIIGYFTYGKVVDNTFGPVSYTHLDVYKRQLQQQEGVDLQQSSLHGFPNSILLLWWLYLLVLYL